MKLAKSILRPTTFLTRRRHSPSPSLFRKKRRGRGSGLEATTATVEPSSPKVTCIGQVRVKSKRKSKQCRSLSSASRRGNFGDASFRKTADHQGGDVREYSRVCSRRRHVQSQRSRNHQRWVHLPISICEALSDFCCFFHCKPCHCQCQCDTNNNCSGCWCSSCSCGSGRCCRWLLCVNDGGGRGSRREIEVVVSGGVETEVRQRRHVLENIEVRNGRIEVKGQSELEVEEAPRVSICIPPKNALLLMRCRSDPMKMAALVNRISWAAAPASDFDDFQQSPPLQQEEEDDQLSNPANNASIEPVLEMEVKVEPEENKMEEEEEEEEEVESNMSSFEALLDQEARDQLPECPVEEPKKPEESESDDKLATIDNPSKEEEEEEEEEEKELLVQVAEEENQEEKEEDEEEEAAGPAAAMNKGEENQTPVLPDCLLLMMCEPKLSMEVSKETWVRGADFIRWLPPRKPAKSTKTTCCHHDPPPKKAAKPTKPPSLPAPPPPLASKKNDHQPPRSSCSLPSAASSMANMIEQKLVAGGAYGPFALPRCKSEPIRTAAAKLMPAEPYRVGAAGVIS